MRTAQDVLSAVPERLLQALRDAAPADEARLWLVGGCVRDALLGRPNHDLDLAVDGDVSAIARRLAGRLGGAAVPLDPEHGTYRVALREPIEDIRELDLTRLRAPAIEQDLRLRDFTINAVALPVADSSQLLDPTGGTGDLAAGSVRMTSPETFRDDPLRLLRAARFAVELAFTIDDQTAAVARRDAHLLPRAAAERQRDEFARVLATDRAAQGVRLLDRLSLLRLLLPDLEAARGVGQPREHYYDVFEHSVETLAALDLMLRRAPPGERHGAERWAALWARLAHVPDVAARLDGLVAEGRPRRVALKFAALLHDVSKPETKSIDPKTGKVHFYGHPDLGAKRAGRLARALRFSSREIELIELLVAEHLRPGMLASPGEPPTPRALFRFYRDLDGAVEELLLLNLADHAAARGPRLRFEEWVRHVDYITWLLRTLYEDETVSHPPRLLDGNDLMRELALAPGPLIGRLLEAVREAQAAGEVRDREAALALARRELAAAGEG
ncbi:MAG TPA: HD domain-containing protein [Dehalococcoidia bacterium]|nr:HD domain-containing protein [Dehalococcoidia bacterium]